MRFGGETAAQSNADQLMIFPNSAKDIETAFYPYAELFRDFSTAVCRPNAALVTYGYGFGDDHVNRIIRDMLSLPSTHLVIASYDDAAGRIPKFLAACGRQAQISYMIGPLLADLEPLIDHYLPKPAIDSITTRQTELLGDAPTPPRNDRKSAMILAQVAGLHIGSVETSSPTELKILLDTDAPQDVAFNTGQPRDFRGSMAMFSFQTRRAPS